MKRAFHAMDRLSYWVGFVASWLLPALVLVMVYEVIARYAFTAPTRWSFETSMFLTGSMGMLGGAYGLATNAHIRVDVLQNRLPTRGKAVLDIVGLLLLLLVFVFALLWEGWPRLLYSFAKMETSDTAWAPVLWPARLSIAIGATLLLLQAIVKLIRDFRTAITGRKEV